MPPWLCATQMSRLIGVTRCRARAGRIWILPTTGPLPCVTTSSEPGSISGRSMRPVRSAMSFCSSTVPGLPAGWSALPPTATRSRSGSARIARLRLRFPVDGERGVNAGAGRRLEALAAQDRVERRQRRRDGLLAAVVAHRADPPDPAAQRPERGADLDAEILEEPGPDALAVDALRDVDAGDVRHLVREV